MANTKKTTKGKQLPLAVRQIPLDDGPDGFDVQFFHPGGGGNATGYRQVFHRFEPDVPPPIPFNAAGFRNLDGQCFRVPDRIPFFRQLPERQQRILYGVFRIRVTSGSPVETPRQGCQLAPDPVRKICEFLLRHHGLSSLR